MSLVVEDGTGVQDAESYATVAYVDAYWAARTHDANSATWAHVDNTTAKKEGALRSATEYLDQVYGPYYKGVRKGYVQGLLWPRTGALDELEYPLPALPEELKKAVAALAVRASAGPLMPDIDQAGAIKRTTNKVGSLEETIEYASPGETTKVYGTVDGLLSSLVTNGQGAPTGGNWVWR